MVIHNGEIQMKKRLPKKEFENTILKGIQHRNRTKIYCKRGHLLPAKTPYYVKGKLKYHRICKECESIRNSKYRENRKNNGILDYNIREKQIKNSKFPMVERLKIESKIDNLDDFEDVKK